MSGFGTSTKPLGGPCVAEAGFGGGTEDLAAYPERGLLYVSADPRRREAKRGGVWLVTMKDGAVVSKTDVTAAGPEIFHPHGIDIWTGAGGPKLFVINHLDRVRSQVEVFRIEDSGALTWLGKSQPLPRPNDLVAVSGDSFYVVRDHAAPPSKRSFGQSPSELAENVFGLPLASVLYVDKGVPSLAYKGLRFPAGIAASRDFDEFYVSESTGRRIQVLKRLPDNRLEHVRSYAAGPMPDNLTRVDDRIFYGAHSRFLGFLSHARNPNKPSPGRVEVLDLKTGEHRPVLRPQGFSALSVGAPYQKKLLIGSIFTHAIGVCDAPVP
jgi:arylesterase/paraoxonase